jgi:cellobiose epimerase
MLPLKRFLVITILLVIYSSCSKNDDSGTNPFIRSEYWNQQALNDILPNWTSHVIDSANSSFYCNLNADWKPENDTVRFPSMIARHLFGYSVGYLLSGDEQFLTMAKQIKDYLLSNAWDKKFGGWFNALHPDGTVLQSGKSTFVQLYVITGLTLYYFITHDQEILEYIDQSNDLLEAKVWDYEHGGYYDHLNQDWTLQNSLKTISAQLAPSSGYLLYLYLATRDLKYLKQSVRIMGTITEKMVDPKTGWILESFDQELNYLPGRKDDSEINIGHNIEVAWTLLRIYMISKSEDDLTKAKILSDRLHRYGFDSASGVWYATIGNEQPETHSDYTHWWIQAYGHMFDLCLARLYPDEGYVDSFTTGAQFWDASFVDHVRGDTHLSVATNGSVKDDRKANQFKASYHNMEHSLLNSLYLSCWINKEPITLHFKITKSTGGELLYPLPVEQFGYTIKDIRINDQDFSQPPSLDFIKLPALAEGKIQLTVIPK